jgi:hypothetical protein
MEDWLAKKRDSAYPIDKVEFCRLYTNAPDFMKGHLECWLGLKDEAIGQYEKIANNCWNSILISFLK